MPSTSTVAPGSGPRGQRPVETTGPSRRRAEPGAARWARPRRARAISQDLSTHSIDPADSTDSTDRADTTGRSDLDTADSDRHSTGPALDESELDGPALDESELDDPDLEDPDLDGPDLADPDLDDPESDDPESELHHAAEPTAATVEVVVEGAPPEVVLPAPGPVPPTFAELGVVEPLVRALADQGIHTAFPIQAMAVPLALTGTDLIGQARTGTGKTLGFALPILQALAHRSDAERADRRPRALVVAPTRELASQVAGEFRMAGSHLGARVATIYGGRAYEPQITELSAGVDVVVGTPGRLLDLYGQHLLDLSAVGVLVLDEADEMLDLGFLPDVERIIAAVPQERQTMLFSATMPGAVVSLARRHLTSPVNLRAESAADTQMVPETTQFVYQAHAMDKIEIVARLLQARGRGLAMVFARTKRTAQRVAEDLAGRGFAAAPLHGDLGQGAREQALRAFRAGKVDVLVCTDVAARGIDVDGITHVVNWACPEDERTYVHRIGRTGRAGATGVAVTFVDWEDVTRWRVINKALELDFNSPPETYSTSPHLFADLDIPEGTKGTLPVADRSRAGLGAEVVEDLGGREPRSQPAAPARHAPRAERERTEHGSSRPAGGAARSRTRRSTTGSEPAHDASPAAVTAATPHAAAEPAAGHPRAQGAPSSYWDADSRPAPVAERAAGPDGAPRARRRRRTGAGSDQPGTGGADPGSASTPAPGTGRAPAEASDSGDTATRRPRRRRRRSAASGDSAGAPVAEPTA